MTRPAIIIVNVIVALLCLIAFTIHHKVLDDSMYWKGVLTPSGLQSGDNAFRFIYRDLKVNFIPEVEIVYPSMKSSEFDMIKEFPLPSITIISRQSQSTSKAKSGFDIHLYVLRQDVTMPLTENCRKYRKETTSSLDYYMLEGAYYRNLTLADEPLSAIVYDQFAPIDFEQLKKSDFGIVVKYNSKTWYFSGSKK